MLSHSLSDRHTACHAARQPATLSHSMPRCHTACHALTYPATLSHNLPCCHTVCHAVIQHVTLHTACHADTLPATLPHRLLGSTLHTAHRHTTHLVARACGCLLHLLQLPWSPRLDHGGRGVCPPHPPPVVVRRSSSSSCGCTLPV